MTRVRFVPIVGAVVLTGLLLAGCGAVVDGQGTVGGSTAPTDFPSSSGASTPSTPGSSTSAPPTSAPTSGPSGASVDLTCPDVSFPNAALSFRCITTGMRFSVNPTFPTTMVKTVEAATGWSLDTGATAYLGSATSPPAISSDVRADMIESGSYGTSPSVHLDGAKYLTVDGHRAYLTTDTVTLSRTYAQSRGTKVRTEKRWLLVIAVGSRYTLWYASIPDLAKQLWSKVDGVISSIRVDA
ncbi:hypothetical protein SAMN05443575_0978 [Jatrophihabitans endophyticus]|uniref:Uncharacterized protein n=1 Tax=Jatrophihabitans endophyticus TaxID=1206085 RepID=A0A1M5ERN2_9ACTN|nr:hypothetical protein [Jatrophihabitans endophyticus]SHF81837.1 hypothetical protein SAMN05443575_0978 [Jatrophihabitans endophyticus]